MDDYKRTLYMEARRRLSLPSEHLDKETFLCCALANVLLDEGYFFVNGKHFQKLFTEFRQLWDGYYYTSNGARIRSTDPSQIWWGSISTSPRIAMIDFLLCREDNSRARRGY